MKNIKIVLFAFLISFLIGFFLIKDYKKNIKKSINYGFLYGEFTKEEFDLETIKLSNYIYKINDSKYEIYLGITRNEKNIDKLKEFFIKKGYDISIRDISISKDLADLIDSCDKLLERVEEDKSIEQIENKILEYGVI